MPALATSLWETLPQTILALATFVASMAALVTAWRSGKSNDLKIDATTKKVEDVGRKSEDVGHKVEELHIAVNSRLTQLLEQTAKASRAEGAAESTKANAP